jgi:hypothetical protein
VCSVGFSYVNEGIFFRPPSDKHVTIIKHIAYSGIYVVLQIAKEKR